MPAGGSHARGTASREPQAVAVIEPARFAGSAPDRVAGSEFGFRLVFTAHVARGDMGAAHHDLAPVPAGKDRLSIRSSELFASAFPSDPR